MSTEETMVVKLSDGSVYRFHNVTSSWIEGSLLTIRYKTGSEETECVRFGASYVVFAGNEDIFNQQLEEEAEQ